jgi:hypothetical protein
MISLSMLGGVGTLVAALLALIFRNKIIDLTAKAAEAQVVAKDAPLVAQQAEDQAKIKQTDDSIQQLKDERERLRNQYVTDQQKADSWNKK